MKYFSFEEELIGWVNSRLEKRESATHDTTVGLIICLATFEVSAFLSLMDASEFCRGGGYFVGTEEAREAIVRFGVVKRRM